MVQVEGKEIYSLGTLHANDQLYLTPKNNNQRMILCLVENSNKKYYQNIINSYLEESSDLSIVVIDPKKRMIGSSILEREEVYYIPAPILPIRLLFAVEGVVVKNNLTLIKILQYLQINLLVPEAKKCNAKLNVNCAILSVKSIDDIVELHL